MEGGEGGKRREKREEGGGGGSWKKEGDGMKCNDHAIFYK